MILPNNTTVCTFSRIRFQKSRTARFDKNIDSCPKNVQYKTVTGCIFYNTNKNITNEKKTRQINLFNAVPKTFKDAKFVVDGNAFETFITLSTKNFCLMLTVHLGLNSLYL